MCLTQSIQVKKGKRKSLPYVYIYLYVTNGIFQLLLLITLRFEEEWCCGRGNCIVGLWQKAGFSFETWKENQIKGEGKTPQGWQDCWATDVVDR